MISHRLVLATVVLTGFGTACTALVLGQVSDTDGYTTLAPGVTPDQPGALDKCSLLKSDTSSADRDANACSDCIQNSCPTDVAFACNRDKSPKTWFSKMKDCAQGPWQGSRPPSEPSGFYGCRSYEKPVEAVVDNGSESEREATAHNCINSKCASDDVPACKLCEVMIEKPGSTTEKALLSVDECGKCIVLRCAAPLAKCCNGQAVNEFVEKCAFTNLGSNKATCLELGKPDPDAGHDKSNSFNETDLACLKDIGTCFMNNCAGKGGCK